jgi:beta-glucanase (GH16 family)
VGKRASIPLGLVALSLGLAASAGAQDWGLVWSDEFDSRAGSPPDPARWTFDTGNPGVNNEQEVYCATGSSTPPCESGQPNAVQDGQGHLVIQAIRTSSGTWTSARLKTQGLHEFRYGRIEASMRLPVGTGLWPAFWMLGTNFTTVGWPGCGEIDIMENVPAAAPGGQGLGPSMIQSTLHGAGYSGASGLGQRHSFSNGGRVDTAFHTYGAIWSPQMVQFYVDDPHNVFFVRTASDIPAGAQWGFDHDFFVIMNLAVGGDWPGPPDATTPSPSRVLVDHVRLYHAAPVPGPSMSTSPIVVKSGAVGTTTIGLDSASGSGRVFLACSGAPAHASCSLNPYVADFTSKPSATTTLTVVTAASAGVMPFDGRGMAATTGAVLLGLILLAIDARGRSPRLLAGLALCALLLVAALTPACGGGGGSTGGGTGGGSAGTPPGNYTITVTAYTVSGHTSTIQIPLTVN